MKLKHYDHDGHVRFVTFCTHQRLPLLTNNRFRHIVVDAVDEARKVHGFKLLAYVIIPEHVHLVILPPAGMKLGYVIGEIKRRSARKIHKSLAGAGEPAKGKLTATRDGRQRFVFWQRRCYDHNCRDDDSVWKKVNYCHQNPVSRGLVKDATGWEWSSWRAYQGESDVPLMPDMIFEAG